MSLRTDDSDGSVTCSPVVHFSSAPSVVLFLEPIRLLLAVINRKTMWWTVIIGSGMLALLCVWLSRVEFAVMKQYVHSGGFPTGLVGLTGTQAQIDAAASAFKVFHQSRPVDGAQAGAYNVDHTSLLYVLDRQWRTRAAIDSVHASQTEIAQCIAAGLERRG